MKLARRNRSARKQDGAATRHRSLGNHVEGLQSLESRVLLTGETSVIIWGGQYLEVAKDQYIVSANAATAAALQQTLNAKGLHATNVVKLGTNVFGIVDSADTVAQVQSWAVAHKTVVTSLTPN